jgi:hypothetical protein
MLVIFVLMIIGITFFGIRKGAKYPDLRVGTRCDHFDERPESKPMKPVRMSANGATAIGQLALTSSRLAIRSFARIGWSQTRKSVDRCRCSPLIVGEMVDSSDGPAAAREGRAVDGGGAGMCWGHATLPRFTPTECRNYFTAAGYELE